MSVFTCSEAELREALSEAMIALVRLASTETFTVAIDVRSATTDALWAELQERGMYAGAEAERLREVVR